MDIPVTLEALTASGRIKVTDDWGPMAQSTSTYAQFAAKWRGTSAVPTLVEMNAAWTILQSTRPELFDPITADRKALKSLIDSPNGIMRVLIAKGIVDWNNIPALKTAFPTLAAYVTAVKAQLDNT